MTIQERIEKFRITINLSRTQFAKRCNITHNSYFRYVTNTRTPRISFLISLYENFPELNFDWLMTGKGEMIQEIQDIGVEQLKRIIIQEEKTTPKEISILIGDLWIINLERELKNNNYKAARSGFELCEIFFSHANDTPRLAKTFYYLGLLCDENFTDFAKAEKYYSQALEIWKDKNDIANHLKVQLKLALLLMKQGKSQRAKKLSKESIEISEKLNLKYEFVLCLHVGANIEKYSGTYRKAQSYYEKALEICQKHNFLDLEAKTFFLISPCFYESDPEKAIKFCHQAESIWTALNEKKYLYKCHGQLATFYLKLKNLGKAKKHIEKAINLTYELGDVLSKGKQHLLLARIFLSDGDQQNAEIQYQLAFDLFVEIGATRTLANAYFSFGKENQKLEKFKVSEFYFLKALKILQKVGDNVGISQIEEELKALKTHLFN